MNNRKAQRLSQRPEQAMVVVFRRVRERGYAVEVRRPGFPDLEMNPAPGYNQLIPHDLMHMVVEAQLGLNHGIFGQLATGGDAGTFHPVFTHGETSREIARVRTRVKERGRKLLREGRNDCARSERATFICSQYWMSQSQGKDAPANTVSESGALNQTKLTEICKHLDNLSSHWSKLEVGQSMTVHWPTLVTSVHEMQGV
jgi:hypothetical protein